MNDMAEYFSDKDRIKQLESENELLRAKLKKSQTLSSKHKIKWRKLYEEYNAPIVTRSDKALILIEQKHNGMIDITLKEIAKRCFVTYQHARCLSSKYKRGLNNEH